MDKLKFVNPSELFSAPEFAISLISNGYGSGLVGGLNESRGPNLVWTGDAGFGSRFNWTLAV